MQLHLLNLFAMLLRLAVRIEPQLGWNLAKVRLPLRLFLVQRQRRKQRCSLPTTICGNPLSLSSLEACFSTQQNRCSLRPGP